MSDRNPFISSGTCYSDSDEQSPSDVLPCGNADLGAKSCCYSGDMCLEETYCFNERKNITYTVACTDPAYEDDKCDQNRLPIDWERVIICTGGAGSSTLYYCGFGDVTDPPTDEVCLCPEIDGEQYTRNNSFYDDVVLLPDSKGESVVWQPGYVPTSSDDLSSASETGPGATVTIDADGGDDDDGGGRGGLSIGAKAGIGVGVSLAGVFALGIIFLLWRRRTTGLGAAAEAKKGGGPSDMAELPVRAGTPPPGELEAGASSSGIDGVGPAAERRESAEAADGVSGVRPGGVGNDRTERTMSVVSELE